MLKCFIASLWAALLCSPVCAQVKPRVDRSAATSSVPAESARKVRQAKEDDEVYTLELTALPVQGAKPLNTARHSALVNVIYTDGFFISLPLKSASDGKLMGVGRAPRLWKEVRDVPISHLEVVYSKGSGGSRDGWSFTDIEVRSFAHHKSDPGKQKEWQERDFFSRTALLNPGQVVIGTVKQPLKDPLPWLTQNHFVSYLQAQLMIGEDDVKTNYKALNLAMMIRGQPGVVYRYSIAGNGEERRLLTGGSRLFRLDENQWRNVRGDNGTWIFKNEGGIGPPDTTRFADITKLWLEYDFGDHGAFENDDWTLMGLCINWGGDRGYGYRYYTQWDTRHHMSRTSRVDIIH